MFEIHPESARFDKTGGRKIRTIDIREYSKHYDTGDYAAKFYVDTKMPDHDIDWMKGYVVGLPYENFKHEHLVYLVLKKYLSDRGYAV